MSLYDFWVDFLEKEANAKNSLKKSVLDYAGIGEDAVDKAKKWFKKNVSSSPSSSATVEKAKKSNISDSVLDYAGIGDGSVDEAKKWFKKNVSSK